MIKTQLRLGERDFEYLMYYKQNNKRIRLKSENQGKWEESEYGISLK